MMEHCTNSKISAGMAGGASMPSVKAVRGSGKWGRNTSTLDNRDVIAPSIVPRTNTRLMVESGL